MNVRRGRRAEIENAQPLLRGKRVPNLPHAAGAARTTLGRGLCLFFSFGGRTAKPFHEVVRMRRRRNQESRTRGLTFLIYRALEVRAFGNHNTLGDDISIN